MVATPLASLLGVEDTVRLKVPHNPTLESYYCNITKNPTQVDTSGLLLQHHKGANAALDWITGKIIKSDLFVLFSVFSSKSLQEDWLLRKTSAAMVQETKEPGQTESAQKVSRGQVCIRALLNIYDCCRVHRVFLWQYEHISEGKSSPLFLHSLQCCPCSPHTHSHIQPCLLAQGLCSWGCHHCWLFLFVSQHLL